MTALIDEIRSNLTRLPESACRVLHGRGKAFPGHESLNIEWYPPYLFVQNFGGHLSEATEQSLKQIFEEFTQIQAVLVQARERPDFVTRILISRSEFELPITQWTSLDDGITCETTLGKNRNTGVFLDMRAGWHWIKDNAQDKRVLNLFSYTGVFSLFALKGGASRVDNVDMAANVLKISQRNHQRNGSHDNNAAFYKRTLLKSGRWLLDRPKYDLIITDPPPYQKKVFRGWSDYQKLLLQCKECLAEEGALFTCLNNPQVTLTEYKNNLRAIFPDAKSIQEIATAKEIKELDENKGLKTVIVQF